MKFLKVLGAVLVIATTAQAQFVNGPSAQSALTVSTAFMIPAATLTNIPTTLAPVFKPGSDGITLYVLVAGTNAATTTNATITLEPVVGSRVVDNYTALTYGVPQNGTTGYDYLTNIAATVWPNSTPGIRIRSIENTNTYSIFITNVTVYTR